VGIPGRIQSVGVTIFALCLAANFGIGQTADHPVQAVPDPGVVTTRQSITPAGVQSVFSGRVYGVAFGSSSEVLYVALNSGAIYELRWQGNQVLRIVRGPARPGMQGVALDPVTSEPLLSASFKNASQLTRISGNEEGVIADHLGTFTVGGLSAAAEKNTAGERDAGVALTFNDALAVIDLASGKLKGEVKTGIAPFGVAVNRGSTVAYVSNWGGRFPRPEDVTSPTGNSPNADQVVVDKRGIASSGTVARVDLGSLKVTNEVAVGLHPTALHWDEAHARLFVTNSNSDSISVVNTQTNQVAQTISLQPFARKVAGIAPNALAVSTDGKTLYVACGGINAVAVLRTADGRLEGLIPTAWYPNDLRLSPDGQYLAVANLMGVGPGGNDADVERWAKRDHLNIQPGPTRRFVHSDRSSVQVIRLPDAAQLSGYTTAVIENNKMLAGNPGGAAAPSIHTGLKPLPVPLHAGDPSLIDHVVFIIKENRTYDQILGDLAQANSDPTLLVYGRDVTPNHHRLAEQFVVLDNFYATGGNSADGHQWLTQAAETDYVYWPGYTGRSYPFEGSDPVAPASSGFIWDAALSRNRTVEDFGEYVGVPAVGPVWSKEHADLMGEWKKGADLAGHFHVVAPLAPLNKILAKDYPYWTVAVPDVVRAQIFLKHLQAWEKNGSMPNLVLVQLPNDHTAGTDPGMPVPQAMIADNDLALGQIVAGLSHSRFWKSMAILVVEDDAQSGLDHVDGHRTVALAISPYTCRDSVDSTFYSQTSMLKTIELMLGLPTLSVFDLIANDMRNSFQLTPNFTPYDAVTPKQSLEELNPPLESLKGPAREAAAASMKMNFNLPDAAPTDKLNRILWHQARGWHTPYPRAGQAVFAPYAVDLDDQEKKERNEAR
jgi:YVTN family beta-propeller protein